MFSQLETAGTISTRGLKPDATHYVAYYTDLIQSNPEWEFAGIFADRGISGTKDTIRPEFMKMIEHCQRHKIDLIFTKSLSRFSRNTLDSIKYIPLLKSLNVTIEFEKEGLNTSDVSSEIYLTDVYKRHQHE